jgi:hypothetical protein
MKYFSLYGGGLEIWRWSIIVHRVTVETIVDDELRIA